MNRIMGIDAGFTGMGVVVAEGRTVVFARTGRTEKNSDKRSIRVADDDTERCQHQVRFLLDVIATYKPLGLVVEMPSGGAQSARANRAMGMATAIVGAVAEVTGLPLEVVTPQMVKKAATGRNDGAKEAVEAKVRTEFDWGIWMPKTKAEREHVCDAAGTLLAARNGTLMRALERMGA